jgi:mycothiol synthase
LAAIEAADGLAALTEHKMMHLGQADGTGGVVAKIGDTVIGYAQIAYHHGDDADSPPHWAIELAVDPDHRTPEVYSPLIAAAAALVPDGDRYVVWAWHRELELALVQAGYRTTRRLHRLVRPLPVEATAAPIPGITIKPYEVGRNETAWLEVNNAAFAGHPENGALTPADLEERLLLPWFDPADLLMAWEGEDLVGSCWTKHHANAVGEIYIIGVSPHAQGRGLGRTLLLRGLDHLYRTGSTTGMLYADGDNRAAMWLYADLGFQPVLTNRQYEPFGQ